MKPRTFWLTAVLSAAIFAAASRWLFPYAAIGIETSPDRLRVWLLSLWTFGVLAICFGAAGLIGAWGPLGFSDVAEHGSVAAAAEAKRELARRSTTDFYNFASWSVVAGAFLIVAYFIAWGIY